MPVEVHLLCGKAHGSIAAIESLSPKEREKAPMEPFALDFNKLLAMVSEARPDLAPVLPAAIEIINHAPRASYGEILAYLKQIYELHL